MEWALNSITNMTLLPLLYPWVDIAVSSITVAHKVLSWVRCWWLTPTLALALHLWHHERWPEGKKLPGWCQLNISVSGIYHNKDLPSSSGGWQPRAAAMTCTVWEPPGYPWQTTGGESTHTFTWLFVFFYGFWEERYPLCRVTLVKLLNMNV